VRLAGRRARRQLGLVKRPSGEGIAAAGRIPRARSSCACLRISGFLGRLLYRPSAFAFAMPPIRRSLRRSVSNSANTPSMSRKHLRAAVLVSIGCSVAVSAAPGRCPEVAHEGRQAVDPGHTIKVALRNRFAALLGTDDIAAPGVERRLLQAQVLISGDGPRVADDGHYSAPGSVPRA